HSTDPGSSVCTACELGTAQPAAGAPTCDTCPAGTYQWYYGSTECTPCARDSFSAPGAEICEWCGCDDGIACTRDTCDAATGACSAPPIEGCAVATLSFEGSVVSVDPALAACFEVGDSVAGTVEVDPERPDRAPEDLGDAVYGGPEALQLEIGDGPEAVTFV